MDGPPNTFVKNTYGRYFTVKSDQKALLALLNLTQKKRKKVFQQINAVVRSLSTLPTDGQTTSRSAIGWAHYLSLFTSLLEPETCSYDAKFTVLKTKRVNEALYPRDQLKPWSQIVNQTSKKKVLSVKLRSCNRSREILICNQNPKKLNMQIPNRFRLSRKRASHQSTAGQSITSVPFAHRRIYANIA